nr:MAG TPA: tail sheath protein [Caudoviricetes sp.]
MAQITINEVSQNYTYNIGTNSFCTVALPITASWGPAFVDPDTVGEDLDTVLENTVWQRFPATQSGLESFVSTYRGPAANYRIAKDYSYQMAMTLLTSGYDVLVCRLCPGTHAQATLKTTDYAESKDTQGDAGEVTTITAGGSVTFKAKYPGTFGNSLIATLNKIPNRDYWNLIVYVLDSSGVKTAVENIVFAFELEHTTDSILHIQEVESAFLTFTVAGTIKDSSAFDFGKESGVIRLGVTDEDKGTDRADDADASTMMDKAIAYAKERFKISVDSEDAIGTLDYIKALESVKASNPDDSKAATLKYNEWLYTFSLSVYDLLKDKLAYNPNRVISPGWDDQDISGITDGATSVTRLGTISPIHIKLMDVAYYSRCATALLDIPRSLPRSAVYNDSTQDQQEGYAQKLARFVPKNAAMDINGSLYQTHSALFAPWGQYTYVGTSKQNPASPSFMTLLIQRAMLLNQSLQYEWAMPTNRKHKLAIGKLDYTVPKKLLDIWQTLEGVGVNVITTIPDLGTSLWGNSTLYEVPPATYQALANLSTRYLVNAIENIAYKAGISITFQYNNDEAYSKFYAAVTPILDTMKNVGAIDGYYVKMAADINGLDQVNANTVIGKIYLVINGVINDIVVDLIALPPGTDLTQFQA